MANEIKWTAREHSRSKQKGTGKHVVLAAYKPQGSTNKVLALFPLYDLRDYDLNGSVSPNEWLFGGGWMWDPFYLLGLMNSAATTEMVMDIARQLDDLQLGEAAKQQMLKQAHKVCGMLITDLLVEKLLMPGIELTLAETALKNMGTLGSTIAFVVEQTAEASISAAINGSRN